MPNAEFNSENNAFIAIVDDESLSNKQKKAAIVEALAFDFTKTAEENEQQVQDFLTCKAYVEEKFKNFSAESVAAEQGSFLGSIKAAAVASKNMTDLKAMMEQAPELAARRSQERCDAYVTSVTAYKDAMRKAFPQGLVSTAFDKGGDLLIKAIEVNPQEKLEDMAKGALTEGFKKVGTDAAKKAGKEAGAKAVQDIGKQAGTKAVGALKGILK